ncbi:MAG: hypothetical protein LBU47_06955 [Christensenellaceae bacterium]|jgi:hypothetical protein|nr:hypothetical protein [Christensenellaceae bacterium]
MSKKPRKMLGFADSPHILRLMRLIETQSKPTISSWCLDYAEAWLLPIFERAVPGDSRPRIAIEAARSWLRGENKLQDVRDLAWESHLAAKDAKSPAAEAAARAVANAALSVHVSTHSLGIAAYGSAAIAYERFGTGQSDAFYEAVAAEECAKMELALRAIAVKNEPNPAPCKWTHANGMRKQGD